MTQKIIIKQNKARPQPTVQRRLALSGKLCFNSLWPVTNVTGQGNGLRSRIVGEKRGGPGITVKAKKKKKNV